MFSWLDLLTNPLLKACTLATLFMSISCALLGGLLFVKRASLLGETLSHAAYPGVVLGLIASLVLPFGNATTSFIWMLFLGAVFVFAGDKVAKKIQNHPLFFSDIALSVVLALFFSLGVFFSSLVQYKWPASFSAIPVFLFGQLATLTDMHMVISGVFLLFVILYLTVNYRALELALFDRGFAKNMGARLKRQDHILTLLMALAIVIGIRSLGAVLISGMLIAPSVGARILTKRLSSFLIVAALISVISAFVGIYYSLNLPLMLGLAGKKVSLPTGPMVLLAATVFSCLALVVAPGKGLMGRVFRGAAFNWRSAEENVLKTLWKAGSEHSWSFKRVREKIGISSLFLAALLITLKAKDKISFSLMQGLKLTELGAKQARNIVRVHRLWELYLFSCLGVEEDKVHGIAEQVEHVSGEELEQRLTVILGNPSKDPHNQPIPKEGRDESL